MVFLPQRGSGQDVFNSRAGDVLGGRYTVQGVLGRGNFARVFAAASEGKAGKVAVKVLRKQHAVDARAEAEIMRAVGRRDPRNLQNISRMLECFVDCGGCVCLVFELLGKPLSSKPLGPDSVRPPEISAFASQIAGALRFLHFECSVVHTDLKPDNILWNPAESSWVVCDFGSASFVTDTPDCDVITTQPYRAPEVVFSCPWSYAVDIWSFGCILYEFAVGKSLFTATSSPQKHVAQMKAVVGPLPRWLASSGWVCGSSSPSLDAVPGAFGDLLRRCLRYDPGSRLRADEVLHHPFVAGRCRPSLPVISLPLLPPSPYSSGAIKTPACAALRAETTASLSRTASASSFSSSPSSSSSSRSPLLLQRKQVAAA